MLEILNFSNLTKITMRFLSILFILIFSLTSSEIFSQRSPIKFGKVSEEELTMDQYEKDPEAAAVVLLDYGFSKIDYNPKSGFQLTFDRHCRVKILSKEGYDQADVSIPLYFDGSKKEKILGLKAASYNLVNGKMVETKLKNKETFTEDISKNLVIEKFTLPNVQVGTVIEFSYKIQSDFFHHFQDWDFQAEIPTIRSEYHVLIPEYFHYERFVQGYIPLEQEGDVKNRIINYSTSTREGTIANQHTMGAGRIEYRENYTKWAANHVPAFKPEPYLSSPRNYKSKIIFELGNLKLPDRPIQVIMGTWADLNSSFLKSESFGISLRGSNFLKKIVDEIVSDIPSIQGKVSAIYDYVQNNMAWDGRNRYFISDNLKKILDEGKGSSADINLLFANMVNLAGAKVEPVLLSTRDNGYVREQFAMSSQFNYVISLVQFDEGSLLIDATDKLLPINVLPQRCLNGRGFVVSENNYRWADLNHGAGRSKVVIYSEGELNITGNLHTKLTFTKDGYDARNFRGKYLIEGEDNYLTSFFAGKDWDVKSKLFESVTEIQSPVKESYEFTIDKFSDEIQGRFYLDPILFKIIDDNPFKSDERIYPVDFSYPQEVTYISKIVLPEGFEVEEMPEPLAIALPENAGKFMYNASKVGNFINVVNQFTINKSVFVQQEYPALKEFYNIIVDKQKEMIVLKKQ